MEECLCKEDRQEGIATLTVGLLVLCADANSEALKRKSVQSVWH
jgi:hypothetical protein